MRYALVERQTGRVRNVIEALDTYVPPDGYDVIDAHNASPGDRWDGVRFTPANLLPEIAAKRTRRARMRELLATPPSDWTAAEQREATELLLREFAGQE